VPIYHIQQSHNPDPPVVHTMRVHAMSGTYTLVHEVERLILELRIGPELHGCAPIFVCQAFPYLCEQPSDPWSRTPHALGYRDRVIDQARKLGIEIEFYTTDTSL
jgi:hypothetical protein